MKKIVIPVGIFCALFFLVFFITKITIKKPLQEEKIYIGDPIKTYRFIDKELSYSYLLDISESSNPNTYTVTFVQYYNNNPYYFKRDIKVNDKYNLYKINKTFTKQDRSELFVKVISTDFLTLSIEQAE